METLTHPKTAKLCASEFMRSYSHGRSKVEYHGHKHAWTSPKQPLRTSGWMILGLWEIFSHGEITTT